MAQITLSINADNATELMTELANLVLSNRLTVTVKEQGILTPPAAHVGPTTEVKLDKALDKAIDEAIRTEAAVEEAAAPRKKRGRPATESILPEVQPAPAPVEAIGNTAAAEPAVREAAPINVQQAKDVIFEEAKLALKAFSEANPTDARERAIGMLKTLGVARLTDLDANGLQKFLALIKS